MAGAAGWASGGWRGSRSRAGRRSSAIVGGWVVLARALARPASEQLTNVATASGLNSRELGSYLWQFYLPRLPFMQDFFSVVP